VLRDGAEVIADFRHCDYLERIGEGVFAATHAIPLERARRPPARNWPIRPWPREFAWPCSRRTRRPAAQRLAARSNAGALRSLVGAFCPGTAHGPWRADRA